MKKKFLAALAFSTVALTSVFASSASASGDEAGWQYVGAFDVHVTSNSNVLMSGGGNIEITMWNTYSASQARGVKVYEDDPAGDDYITTILLAPGAEKVVSVSGYTDGTNGKAEIYLEPNGTIGQSTVQATMRD
ncbi:hypothetical protein [Peribacillus frigoritolerans]|uniref:hypothetical protein n=1 Tax=Peribacillus frigoritolerans TaxID=450367 RepID=UPI0022818E90|nr:hypothetical protein [Peribacillus frigoritolerans]MCY9007226.1 hypothetical protein [Peribacillus frigoritolerans]